MDREEASLGPLKDGLGRVDAKRSPEDRFPNRNEPTGRTVTDRRRDGLLRQDVVLTIVQKRAWNRRSSDVGVAA